MDAAAFVRLTVYTLWGLLVTPTPGDDVLLTVLLCPTKSLMFYWSRYCTPQNRLVPSPNSFLNSIDCMLANLAYIINHFQSREHPHSQLAPIQQSKWQHFGTKDTVEQRPDSSTPLCSCLQQGPSSTCSHKNNPCRQEPRLYWQSLYTHTTLYLNVTFEINYTHPGASWGMLQTKCTLCKEQG